MTKFEQRKARILAILESGEPSERRDGKKRQRSRNEKLDRFQRNLTTSPAGNARQSWNYHPEIKQAFVS
jgi:hypothetical protein